MSNSRKFWIPLVIVLTLVIGIILGGYLQRSLSFGLGGSSSATKIQAILDLIDSDYVDSVNVDSISEELIPLILAELDPHSVYIPASELKMVNEQLEGSFSGIGVQFNIIQDTVLVVAVIPGGPSEKMGVMPGDRIISVNDTSFVGKKTTSEVVMKTLRGENGSTVKLGIKRLGQAKLYSFNVKRDEVPVKSVDAYYMLAPKIGYVKVSSFGTETYAEFEEALADLKKQGAQKMLVDLRNNPGGFLQSAINMVNEFLEDGRLIVYTEGKTIKRQDAFADGSGSCKNVDIVVLIDEWSASASEIFAGAIQDNDRGLIVGRRSFGKGLVQDQIAFKDGSAIRLTVARYYIPSGRCIQKPYVNGASEDYEMDIMNRFLHGEFSTADSTVLDNSKKYKTLKGRTVYGGGGVMPDVFVPRDTAEFSPYYNKAVELGYVYDYSFAYILKHGKTLRAMKDWRQILRYLESQPILDEFVAYAEKRGLRKNPYQIRISKELLEETLYAYIGKTVLGDAAFYPILNHKDPMIIESLNQFKKKKLL